MVKFWKKNVSTILGSPRVTFSRTTGQSCSPFGDYIIKKFNFSSIEQVEEMKKQLSSRKILIINAKKIFENRQVRVEDIKKGLDEIQSFLREKGGSVGKIGEQYLILTPNNHIKISN